MGNNNYLRSRRRERKLVRKLRSSGWIACRSAGSKSPFDVWAFHPEKKLVSLIQVKTKKGSRQTRILNRRVYINVSVGTWTEKGV